jgi:preprotein translocase subunit SecD
MKVNMHPRLWILLAAVIISVLFIAPRPWVDGATIGSVTRDSPAAIAGLEGPSAGTAPVMRERVISLDGIPIKNANDYLAAQQQVQPDSLVQLRTNHDSYILQVPPENDTAYNPENPLGLRVTDAPTNNIRKGLDLTGGARVLLQPVEPVSDEVMDLVLANIEERLNVFGLSDVTVRSMRDFSGNQYVLAEVAGVAEQEVIDLLSSQGQFEARIGNVTVFRGGDDITHVGRSATEAGIERCSQAETGHFCNFFFSISLSGEAAQRHADITRDLAVVGGYLSEPIDLYLDGEEVSSLQISSSLRGRAETQIQISGSGSGPTREAAAVAAQAEMRLLQTVLATGSLPVELELVKTDAISPALGDEFISNILLMGFFALLAVIITVSTRYRDWRVAVPMVVAMVSEILIVLGVAAVIGWNLDLAAIAGLLIAIGTGVDDQIIIVDELKQGGRGGGTSKQRMKKAFFIIFAAFFTLLAAMLPLVWAGAGLVRGFAITTVLGVTAGVLITRPAFAVLAQKLVKQPA